MIDAAGSGKIDDDAVKTLKSAGVEVRIELVVPGPIIDSKISRLASRHSWDPLLEAGIEIHEYQPTMYHCKVMIIDGAWVSVGSTNFDERSFRLNSESNLNILDAEFAAQQKQVFKKDKKASRRVVLSDWRERPWGEKILELAASLVSSQL